ncbi:hypothetical protein B0H13DRAFT_1936525, partial [Mycena leptocephala]
VHIGLGSSKYTDCEHRCVSISASMLDLRLTEFIHSGESLLPRAASRGNSRVEVYPTFYAFYILANDPSHASEKCIPILAACGATHEFYPGFKCNWAHSLARIREDTSTSFATVHAAVEPPGDLVYADSRLWILRLPFRHRQEGLVLRHPRGLSMQHSDKRPTGAPQAMGRKSSDSESEMLPTKAIPAYSRFISTETLGKSALSLWNISLKLRKFGNS